MRIEDYALIGDLQTSALVGRNGSVDWLCLPRFDSASCFTALLGEEKHGRWLIAPAGEVRSVSRHYREGTLVLETDFETADGTARVIDFMPPRDGGAPQLMRIVQGMRGHVPMRMQLIIRFGYGLSVPWVQRVPGGIIAQAGPDAVHLSTPVELHGQDLTTVAEFTIQQGSSERCGSCTPMSTPGLPGRPTSPQRTSMEHSSPAPPSSGPVTASPSSRPSMQ